MRRTEARPGWCLAVIVATLASCGLEPNPSPITDPTDGWSDVADATDALDGTWPGNDAHDGGDGQADTIDGGTDGVDGWTDAADGADATEGSDGMEATDTVDATDATDASDGDDATDGWDGADATDGNDTTDGTDGLCPVPPPPGPLAQAPDDEIWILENMEVPPAADVPSICHPTMGTWSVNRDVDAFRAAGGETRVVGPETGFGRVAIVNRFLKQSRTYAVTGATPTCSSESLEAGALGTACEYTASIQGSAGPCDDGVLDIYPGGGVWQPTMTLNPGPPIIGIVDESAAEGPLELPVLRRIEFAYAFLVRGDDRAWLCGWMKPAHLVALAQLVCPEDSQFCAPWIESAYCQGLGCGVALSFDFTTADRLVLEGSP